MNERDSFEQLRVGFLSDGRFFSVEAGLRKRSGWKAWIACIPGDQPGIGSQPPVLKVAGYKEELRRWAEKLTIEEIEQLVDNVSPSSSASSAPPT